MTGWLIFFTVCGLIYWSINSHNYNVKQQIKFAEKYDIDFFMFGNKYGIAFDRQKHIFELYFFVGTLNREKHTEAKFEKQKIIKINLSSDVHHVTTSVDKVKMTSSERHNTKRINTKHVTVELEDGTMIKLTETFIRSFDKNGKKIAGFEDFYFEHMGKVNERRKLEKEESA